MPKFCIHEQHAGICVKTGSYCSEGVCSYEDMRDFIIADDAPIVRCQDCVYARPLKDVKYDYISFAVRAKERRTYERNT